VAWRKLAEIISQYVSKGSLIYVEGKLQTRTWEKDGEKRYATEILVNNMQMLDSKRDADKATGDNGQGPPPEREPGSDDDIPF
jgi:single-strand DNA-binding protein